MDLSISMTGYQNVDLWNIPKKLLTWQEDLMYTLTEPCDNREIIYIYEKEVPASLHSAHT